MSWQVLCPAKINLFLSVGPPDAIGWHPLRSIFQAISLFDVLSIETATEDGFESDADYLGVQNTVTRALTLLRRHGDFPRLKIRLQKQIPAQSGLGGGSSDAAGLIRFSKKQFLPDLEENILNKIALEVGADVPFFLTGGKAKAESYGEKLVVLPDTAEQAYVVVKPEVDCSTPAMFRALDELRYHWRDFPEEDSIYNDFEKVMPDICRTRIDQLLTYGAIDAGLSGSGSAVFGRFESQTTARTAAELVLHSGEDQVWACRSLSREASLQASDS